VTPTITLTSTVGTPLTTITAEKRGIRPLPFLRGYKTSQISAACSSLVHHVIHAKTTTLTRAVPGRVRTVTLTLRPTVTTNTVFTTTTPAAATVTTVVSTTTITETADTSTTITTVCPSATPGIRGIAVTPPGMLRFPNTPTQVQCCSACYDTPGCSAWWSVTGSICAFAVNAPPNTPPNTAQCPAGLGENLWFFGAGDVEAAGGPGPCFGGAV
jgi:hypothetical protein